MNINNPVGAANALMVQRIAQIYLSPPHIKLTRIIEGAHISTRRLTNRASVPPDAITFSHLVEHAELGFSFRFRAVWREERLLRPTATHVVIEQEWDDGDHGSPTAVSVAINEWLQAVTP